MGTCHTLTVVSRLKLVETVGEEQRRERALTATSAISQSVRDINCLLFPVPARNHKIVDGDRTGDDVTVTLQSSETKLGLFPSLFARFELGICDV